MQHQINRKKRFPFSVFLRIEFLSFLATNIGGKTRRDASRRTICREIVTVSATNRRPKPNYHVDVSRSPTFEARLQTMPDPKLSFFSPSLNYFSTTLVESRRMRETPGVREAFEPFRFHAVTENRSFFAANWTNGTAYPSSVIVSPRIFAKWNHKRIPEYRALNRGCEIKYTVCA